MWLIAVCMSAGGTGRVSVLISESRKSKWRETSGATTTVVPLALRCSSAAANCASLGVSEMATGVPARASTDQYWVV